MRIMTRSMMIIMMGVLIRIKIQNMMRTILKNVI